MLLSCFFFFFFFPSSGQMLLSCLTRPLNPVSFRCQSLSPIKSPLPLSLPQSSLHCILCPRLLLAATLTCGGTNITMPIPSPTFAISNNNPAWTPNHHTHALQFSTSRSLKTLNSQPILQKTRSFRIRCTAPDPLAANSIAPSKPEIGGDDGGAAGGGGAGGGDGEGGGGGGNDDGDEEFGALLNFEAVMEEAEARGVKLPLDMVEAAKITGIREMFLRRYLELQVGFYQSLNFWFKVGFFF